MTDCECESQAGSDNRALHHVPAPEALEADIPQMTPIVGPDDGRTGRIGEP
jgi:hypothetical protein